MQINKISNISNSTFQARLVLPDEIKSESLKKAGEYLAKAKKDDKNLYVAKSGLGYIFRLDYPEVRQRVGKDTMGYLLMEKTPEEIVGFLENMIKAIEIRKKYLNCKCTEFDNPDRAVAELFKKDTAIGEHLSIDVDSLGNEDLTKAGSLIHVWG